MSDHASTVSHRTVLLVDDAAETRFVTRLFLSNFGYSVETAQTAEEALLVFDPTKHDVIVTDNSMPGLSGAEMAHIIKLRSPSTPVLMYTGMPPVERSCLDIVLQRPAHLLELRSSIEKLLAQPRL